MAENKSHYNQITIYEVQNWLEKLLKDESRLFLKPDVQNIDSLLDLKSKNEEAETSVKEEIKTKEYLIQFYSNKTEEMKKLIESENVTLNEEAEEFVEKIASLGVNMNLAEPDLTNFLMAVCDLKDKQLKCQEQVSVDCHSLSSVSKKIAYIQKQNRVLEKNLEALEKTVKIQECKEEKLSNSLSFMKIKQQDYERLCKKIEEYLDRSGYDSSLRHNTLVKKSEVVQALEKQYKKNLKHLETYRSLPPNETLAKLEVQKKLEELKEIEQAFSELLESLQNDEHEK